MKFKTKLALTSITTVIILVLASCIPIISTDFTLNIGLQEQWTIDIVIVPVQGFESQSVIDALNSQYANDENLKNLGVKVTVEAQSPLPDGTTPIKMIMQGKGYEKLNQAFNENIITVDDSSGQRLLYFNMTMAQDLMVQSTSFTLSGGKILEHNGTALDSDTVVWRNYTGSMQATMIEPSYLDYWLYIAGAGILCMIVVIIILLVLGLRGSRKKNKIQSRQIPRGIICIQCGNAIPANAVFCPNCGAQQK